MHKATALNIKEKRNGRNNLGYFKGQARYSSPFISLD